jgi:hypothetical protein
MDINGGQPTACLGFDGYFFDTDTIPKDDAGFCLGGSWWDYWFPLACEKAGARIEALRVPILTHKAHPLNYSIQDEIDGYRRFCSAFEERRKQETFSPSQMYELGDAIRARILRPPPKDVVLMPPSMNEIEAMLRLGGDALRAGAELRRLHAEIAALKNSASWRLTAPLRAMSIAIQAVRFW